MVAFGHFSEILVYLLARVSPSAKSSWFIKSPRMEWPGLDLSQHQLAKRDRQS